MPYGVILLRNRRPKRLIFFTVIFAASLIISAVVEKRAIPLLEYYAKAQGASAASEIINETVAKTVGSEDGEAVVSCEKDGDGKIKTINIDAEKLNVLKAKLTANTVKSLRKIENSDIEIPVGTLTGTGLFFGRGPRLRLKLIPEGEVRGDIETDFVSSGVNQTLHRIYWRLDTEFFVILPDKTVNFEVNEKFLLSETVIIGDIPQVYFRNQGD